MEYIMITKAKLKVICEEADLSPYGINAESLDYGDPESRLFLEEILERAKQEFGFDTKHHRVLVQLYPSADGGCEIFINKLGLIATADLKEIKSKKEEKEEAQKQLTEKIFFFSKLDFILEVCNILSHSDFCGKSNAFHIEEKGYYLTIELEQDSASEEYGLPDLDEYSFIAEYGEPQNQKISSPYIREYGRLICKNDAVGILGKI